MLIVCFGFLFKYRFYKEFSPSLSPFIQDGPVFPILKEIRKAALKHLSFAFREFDQL